MSKIKNYIILGAVAVAAYNIGHNNPNSITLGPAKEEVSVVEIRSPACPATVVQRESLQALLAREKREIDSQLAKAKNMSVQDPGEWAEKIADFAGIARTAQNEGFPKEEGDALSNAVGTANSALPFGVFWWGVGLVALSKLYKRGVEDGRRG